jgi:hypothetical protein
MATATRGNAAEARVLAELITRGFDVLVPFGSGQPSDLAVDVGDRLLKVQCKTVWLAANESCFIFNCRTTDHGRGRQPYHGLADLFAVFLPPRDSVYLAPLDGVAAHKGRLRLVPPRNNQRRGVRFAAEFEIDRWTEEKFRVISP